MIRRSLRHGLTAVILLVAMLSQGTWALAGVTGGLTGVAVDADTSAPVAGATVTANSPSQSATVTTDASGHFTFLTLSPDTYTVTVTKSGFQTVSAPGQIVFADTVQTVTVRLVKALKTIAHVTSTGAGALVKSGTTNDVYSVNAAAIGATQALGGGGSLNSAYSAISSVPGAYVPPNQMGYYQTVVIRGGDYDQVGYEFDGVPVNRSFDNYPSSSASSLGNAEVQVYTGSANANAESQGLAGYINQVIKSGTYPGYADGELGIGTPTFYHKAQIETGGATPDRNLSWYVGVAGYNQDFNYVTQDNNQATDNFAGAPIAPVGNPGYAGGAFYAMGPFNYAALSNLQVRDTVANVHIGIPHHNDAGRDDVQVLWDSETIHNLFYSTTNDITATNGLCPVGGAACATSLLGSPPVYVDGLHYTGPASNIGSTFSASGLNSLAGDVKTYYFPSSVNRTAPNNVIPNTASDSIWNDQEIVKLQYTKNIGSTSFLRLYGYTYYSDWLQNGPQTTFAAYAGCCSPDYELTSHTRGLSLQYQNQFNAQNLLSFESGFTTSSTVRDNNAFYGVGSGAAVVVNAADPLDGYCFTPGSTKTQKPVACTGPNGNYQNTVSFGTIQSGGAPALPGKCVDPNVASTACTYLMAENGLSRTYNAVTPRFFSSSLTDEFRPSDRWLLNLGLRLDDFTYIGQNTNTGLYAGEGPNARQFWVNSYNLNTCFNTVTGQPYQRTSPGAPCGDEPNTTNPGTPSYFSNSQGAFTFPIWQPRVSGTYTINPDNVLRFSMGRYTQGPVTAFQQYNRAQDNVASYDCNTFCKFGRFAPIGAILPANSLNSDFSWESHLKGTDWSFKLTPFLRQTQDQNQEFFLDQKTAFVSGLDVGGQRSQGVEFQLSKGDFSRNGLSGQLSFAYTNSYIKYGNLTSGLYGTSVLTTINQAMSQYNAYTAACAPGGKFVGKLGPNHVPFCGVTSSGAAAAPCYTPFNRATGTGGAAVYKCTPGDVGNPYWNDPQTLWSLDANYPTYSIFPGAMQSSNAGFGAPYVATLLLNYKHDKFAVTPSLQFEGGMRYGAPLVNPGIDPAGCWHTLAGAAGANGGGRYDAAGCGQLSAIPDTYTNQFDGLGSFVQPNNIAMNLQLSYDVSPRINLTGVLANLFNTCWGGSVEPWTYNNGSICSYDLGGFAGEILPVGNVYNPTHFGQSRIQPFVKYPYGPVFGPFNQDGNSTSSPFNFFVTATVKI
ncbi:MAG TPA: carboxypeptidase regulatory-like domain-containing protein [Candidatus Baltobacteraceae bacterium]